MRALYRGTDKRVIAAMAMNPRSSRGHAIFTIYVKEIQGIGGEKSAKLNLVDLAGMESSKKSYATEGASNNAARKEEAKNINQSLYALGSVIEKLSASGHGEGARAVARLEADAAAAGLARRQLQVDDHRDAAH